MGTTCPICGTHQPIVQQLTTHQGKVNAFARDVIGFRLGCGHDIFGQEASEFQKQLSEINAKFADEANKLDARRRDEIAKAHVAIKAKVSGGKKQ